ncbi:dihydrolipoamide acetyltransferase family protein [Ammoniphilus sp. CFH 90114]|uniref:dihydrolipoamide acetyltransferase family protein n=1 Tax=Ammoniphilus sp. CFH 90114 TaxID=2493665 RepID=UPI00100E8967|nr:dihydrolipoamide acetyltransferase family protein [Ammoniphilus sp. CFH 90114]RXT08808.1 2-oxo acid dehydrogenase subunit E2 [Ammoniphilus sp. CFH 90114]
MVEFKLPDVGEGMHEGEISKWLVKEGDQVKQDQPLLEVQTDKVNAELTSPVSGLIKKIMFAEGETAHVGQTLVVIDNGSASEVAATALMSKPEEVVEQTQERSKVRPSALFDRALATPYVRQLARELKIDIELVSGSGPVGRVTEEDLRAFLANGQVQSKVEKEIVTPPAVAVDKKKPSSAVTLEEKQMEERIALKGVRKKIAEHLVKSVSIIPHVTHVDELEMDSLKALREKWKAVAEERGVKLTFLPFFIKALVIALKEFKTLNASIDDSTQEIVLKNYYHIGIATDTKDGLIVPVLKNADKKTIYQLAEEISELALRAREGKLTLDEITGGTFTISNVGPIGGLYATPIINHPEVAILGLHKMEPRMVVRDWEGVIRLMMHMSLSFDHRLIDGVTAVRFTNRIKQLLENPDLLMMEMV